jgi:hypothetical protein
MRKLLGGPMRVEDYWEAIVGQVKSGAGKPQATM